MLDGKIKCKKKISGNKTHCHFVYQRARERLRSIEHQAVVKPPAQTLHHEKM
jgi:hypothetical protein